MTNSTADQVLAALAPYGLTDEGGGQWRSNSPMRSGSNSEAFTLIIEDGEHGAFRDHAAKNGSPDSGSLYELAQHLGIETPKSAKALGQAENTKRAYAGLKEYALAHGAETSVFEAAGWREATVGTRPALVYPTQGGHRARFIDGDKTKPPYQPVQETDRGWQTVKGYKTCWYGLERALNLCGEYWRPMVLCNGEASVVVAQSYGIPAFAHTGGEGGLSDALIEKLADVKERASSVILVALDCDDTGRKASIKAAQKLRAVGFVPATVDLGLTDGGDLADFCRLHDQDVVTRLEHLQSDMPALAAPVVNADSEVLALAQAFNGLEKVLRLDATQKKEGDIQAQLARAQSLIDRIGAETAKPVILSFNDAVTDVKTWMAWSAAHPGELQGLRSNIPALDQTVGGFAPEVYVFLGATGMGKSWVIVSLVREFMRQGAGLIVTTESDTTRWTMRLAATVSRVAADKIEDGRMTPDEATRVARALDEIAALHCDILAVGSPTPNQLRASLLGKLNERAYKWVAIDSISKMDAPGADGIYDRTVRVNNAVQSLMQETHLPFLLTSQVGRDVSKRESRIPQLDDGYGGGVIEHNAGFVFGVYRHQYYVDQGLASVRPDYAADETLLMVLKKRWRPMKQREAVSLLFTGSGFYERQQFVPTGRPA